MAAGTKLVMQFETLSGRRSWSIANASPSASVANVKALGAAMITNASFFVHEPLALSGAKIVTTSENVLDVS